MTSLKSGYWVTKRNVLNEIRPNDLTFQEMRFFSIYLSRIHKDQEETRIVRFTLSEFQAIMDLGRLDINYIKNVTGTLLSRILNVNIEDEEGKYKGYKQFQLFKKCTVSTNDEGKWYVEIDAHDDALPLMFNYKNRFTTYRLHNILKLKSANQQKMYELLKQYETVGSREIDVDELKEYLGISKNDYEDRFDNFKKNVINVCQRALKKYTDIQFTYEPIGKRGKSGKILRLIFFIKANDDYNKQLSFDLDILEEDNCDTEIKIEENAKDNEILKLYENRIDFISDACEDEFTFDEVSVLLDEMKKVLPSDAIKDDKKVYDYLSGKYREMKIMNEKKKIKYRYNYLKKLIQIDFKDKEQKENSQPVKAGRRITHTGNRKWE